MIYINKTKFCSALISGLFIAWGCFTSASWAANYNQDYELISIPRDLTLFPGQDYQVEITVRNLTDHGWYREKYGEVILQPLSRVNNIQQMMNRFEQSVYAKLQETVVEKDQIGTFVFRVTAPALEGLYQHQFNLVRTTTERRTLVGPIITLNLQVVARPETLGVDDLSLSSPVESEPSLDLDTGGSYGGGDKSKVNEAKSSMELSDDEGGEGEIPSPEGLISGEGEGDSDEITAESEKDKSTIESPESSITATAGSEADSDFDSNEAEMIESLLAAPKVVTGGGEDIVTYQNLLKLIGVCDSQADTIKITHRETESITIVPCRDSYFEGDVILQPGDNHLRLVTQGKDGLQSKTVEISIEFRNFLPVSHFPQLETRDDEDMTLYLYQINPSVSLSATVFYRFADSSFSLQKFVTDGVDTNNNPVFTAKIPVIDADTDRLDYYLEIKDDIDNTFRLPEKEGETYRVDILESGNSDFYASLFGSEFEDKGIIGVILGTITAIISIHIGFWKFRMMRKKRKEERGKRKLSLDDKR